MGVSEDGSWNFQTGDTQFTGEAYGHPHWGQAAIYRGTDCEEAAQQILDEIAESVAQGEPNSPVDRQLAMDWRGGR